MTLLASILVLALTRAEIVARFRAPVVTQADGLVQVHAECPDDMRREFQTPVARFAAETVRTLYQGLSRRPLRFAHPGIFIAIGNVRTNLTTVTAHVVRGEDGFVTRIRLPAPGYADLSRLRLEVVKGFYRSVLTNELSDAEADAVYRLADPSLRAAEERRALEDYLNGRGEMDDEQGIRLLHRVFEPGKANRRDVTIFASRLFLYPPQQDVRFQGRYPCLSFREAVRYARVDPLARVAAYGKANELPILAGGRSPELAAAAAAYRDFLLAYALGRGTPEEIEGLLDLADAKLHVAWQRAGP